MASLANQTISSTYDGLIKTSTDQPVPVTGVQLLEDGVGNSLALSVGRANQGVTITGALSATSISGVLANGVTATTQTLGDNSTKVATTAYVDAQVTASDLDFAGGTGTGSVDLDSQTFTIAGTANEIETLASGQTITIGLPSSVTVGTLNATTLGGTLSTAAQPNITSVGTLSSLSVGGNIIGTGIIRSSDGTAATPSIQPGVDSNTGLFRPANDTIGISTTGVERLRIDSDGNLLLQTVEKYIRLRSSGTPYGYVRMGDIYTSNGLELFGDNAATIASDNYSITVSDITDAIKFEANGSEAMRLDANGNLGIGSSSPVSKFTLEGARNTNTLTFRSTDDNSTWTAGDKFGSIDFYSNDNSGGGQGVKGSISYISTLGATGAYNAMTFSTASTTVNNIERMRIDAEGRVGIGASSFSTFDKVRITGTNTVANDLVLATPNTAQSRIFFSDTDAEGVGELGYDHASNAMRIVTNGSERLRIDSSGNLGLGTSAPAVEVEIASAAPQIRLTDTDGGYCEIGNASGNLLLHADKGNTETNSYMRFHVDDVERMRIDSSGNVGIGESDPSTPLEIKKLNNATIRLNYGNVGTSDGEDYYGGVEFYTDSPSSYNRPTVSAYVRAIHTRAGTDHNNSDAGLIFGTSAATGDASAAERMRIEAATGNIRYSYNPGSGTLYWQDTTNSATMFYIDPAVYVGTAPFNSNRLIAANSSNISFETGGAEAMRITKDGSVQLNSSDTSYPLNVRSRTDNGNLIYFQRVVSGTSYLSRIYMGTPTLYIDAGGTGGVQLTNGATSWTSASDINLKKDIVELPNVLDKIDNKRCVSYRLKSQDFEQKNIGFIAQDWQEDFPEVVQVNDMDGTLGMTYTETIPILLKAIQELKAEVESLKSQINA